jgi:hypothetical protein
MKKGQGVQFNWIFVVVAGAIILALFLYFGLNYKQIQIAKENAEIARGVDKIVEGMVGTEQYNNITFIEVLNLKFFCNRFTVNNDYTQNFGIKTVFAPEEINSKELFVWIKEVKLPFRVDNVVYITDFEEEYYFDSDPLNLVDNVPDRIRNNFKFGGSFEDEDVFVFFNRPTGVVLNKLNGKKILVFDINTNIVSFYNEREESYFFDDSMIYGAIFSSNFRNYNCSFSKFLDKYKVIKDIYKYKADYLNRNTNCDYTNIRDLLSRSINFNNLYLTELDLANDDLMSRGCEVVF